MFSGPLNRSVPPRNGKRRPAINLFLNLLPHSLPPNGYLLPIVYTDCTYVRRDGVFNPDYRILTDAQSFQNMSDSVLYNVLAYAITDDAKFADSAVSFIDTWFLSQETGMKPNLDYAQMIRGVGRSVGSPTGVL